MTEPTSTPPAAPEAPRAPWHDLDALLGRLEARFRADDVPATPPGYQPDARGRLVPEALIRDEDRLVDDTVRRILAYGLDLADQVARFRAHTHDDLAALLDLLGERYGRPRAGRGRKGNRSFVSYDGRFKVVVQIQEVVAFGPELQVARQIIDGCIASWTDGARAEVQALIQHAFEPDAEGAVRVGAVLRLRRLEIQDPRWRAAQAAIHDSLRAMGTKTYVRLYARSSPEAAWQAVPIDLASGWAPSADDGAGAGAAP